MEKIEPFLQKPVIKVITGMRRTGKTCLMHLLAQRSDIYDHICFIDKEDYSFDHIRDYHHLMEEVKKQIPDDGRSVLLLIDEVQEIKLWEKAVVSLNENPEFDVIVSGSNAGLLSGELAGLLTGRYVGIEVNTLSYSEYLEFNSHRVDLQDYLEFGGLPGLHNFDRETEILNKYLKSVFDSILLRDIVQKHKVRDVQLLQRICAFVFDNAGNLLSAKRIADFFKSQRLSIGLETVLNYLSHMIDAYLIHRVGKYDIKGRQHLTLGAKYYVNDIGIRNALIGYKKGDISGILENLVFLELHRRGYKVFTGNTGKYEVDFVAEKQGKLEYYQVCYLLATPETVEREFHTLEMINDNYPKIVISMDEVFPERNGKKHLNLLQFLKNSG